MLINKNGANFYLSQVDKNEIGQTWCQKKVLKTNMLEYKSIYNELIFHYFINT